MQVGRYEQSMEKGLRKQEKGQHRLHATMHLNLEGDPLTNSVITGAFPQSYHSNPSPNSFNFPTPTRGSKRLIFANSDTMKATIYVWGCLALSLACNALPVSRREGLLPRAESVDGDDRVVYTWSLPDEKSKRAESADGDDRVVYTWSLPDEKSKVKG